MESEIKIVRKVRRPKESPPFYKMETDEKVKDFVTITNLNNGSYGLGNLRTSPHTDLIPLSYLVCRRPIDQTDEMYVNRTPTEPVHNISRYGDNPAECFSIYDGNVRPTGQSPTKWRGFLTMFENHTPLVIPAILPENLVYQKLYILKHGKIDLTKVIVLIDRELDSTSYPNKRTREIYRKELLPLIQSTACNVWKVPQSFISESCFMQDFKLRAAGIRERKQEKQDIMNRFRESIYPSSLSGDGERPPLESMDLSGMSQTITVAQDRWRWEIPAPASGGTNTITRSAAHIIPDENLPW